MTPDQNASLGQQPDLDMAHIEALKSEFADDGGTFFRKLVLLFCKNSEDGLKVMRQAVANEDYLVLTQTAHSVKGSSLNIGARLMATLCASVEDLATERSVIGAAELIERLEREFDLVRPILQSLCPAEES
ncbi:MAG: Hpt domain-containing protein [Candidatus Riflebacteria bacterium]|nr:Hpt domain-containing protein [Candidatus Riflebacteria bacterium]